ncbi:MAG TPA: Ni/Fe hydrogenase subunit alpha [Burkholderiales bacterium]|nr:Ni/Fe hydrogenase subunit alpha [Burkholderiales bacterium]
MAEGREIRVNVPLLARVEGEGALEFAVRDGEIRDMKLRIFEPPRMFEKLLEGRPFHEVPDIVARICGICPVAYQMSAVQALEAAFGVEVNDWILAMRRAMYCGEWIQSHALHVHLLAAPDFLGVSSVIEMAKDHGTEVRRGLALQALGNELIRLFGGRSVHPVGAKVGGFHRAPDHETVKRLADRLRAALPEAEALVKWIASITPRGKEQAYPLVSLRHADEYPMYRGRIVSSDSLDISREQYDEHFRESQVPHSTALHCLLHGQPYLVGPLARLALNRDCLPQPVRDALDGAGVRMPVRDSFLGATARAAEIYFAMLEALRILDDYELPAAADVPVTPRAGVGIGATEAPRGLLWHRYEIDAQGRILSARIVPPTSQNQARIEDDLRLSLQDYGLDRSDDELRHMGEMVIRNYDPCISCATHFLDLRVDRG